MKKGLFIFLFFLLVTYFSLVFRTISGRKPVARQRGSDVKFPASWGSRGEGADGFRRSTPFSSGYDVRFGRRRFAFVDLASEAAGGLSGRPRLYQGCFLAAGRHCARAGRSLSARFV